MCNVTCRMTWIIFNQHLNFAIISDWTPDSMFSIRISATKPSVPLTNFTLISGTISINVTYFFCCLYIIFPFAEIKGINWWKCILFSSMFVQNEKIFEFFKSHTNFIENQLEKQTINVRKQGWGGVFTRKSDNGIRKVYFPEKNVLRKR